MGPAGPLGGDGGHQHDRATRRCSEPGASCCSAAPRSAPTRCCDGTCCTCCSSCSSPSSSRAIHFWRVRKDGGISGPLELLSDRPGPPTPRLPCGGERMKRYPNRLKRAQAAGGEAAAQAAADAPPAPRPPDGRWRPTDPRPPAGRSQAAASAKKSGGDADAPATSGGGGRPRSPLASAGPWSAAGSGRPSGPRRSHPAFADRRRPIRTSIQDKVHTWPHLHRSSSSSPPWSSMAPADLLAS